MIKWLVKKCGDIRVERGRKHNYLGIDLDFECRENAGRSMIPYVEEMTKNFPEEVGTSTAATPAVYHLFHVRNLEEAKLLPEK